MLSKDFNNLLSGLDLIPNVPFFKESYICQYESTILNYCNDFKIENLQNGLLISINNNKASKNLVLHSHIDHPGFTVNNGYLYSAGSVFGGYKSNLLDLTNTFKVDLYDINANFISTVDAKAIRVNKAKVLQEVPKKAVMAIPHGLNYKADDKKVYARSLDNNLSTSIALNVLKTHKDNNNYNVYIYLSYIEEVAQISSVSAVINKTLPRFFYLDKTEHIFLECPFTDVYRGFNYNEKIVKPILDKGIIIRLSEQNVLYNTKNNLSLNKLINTSKNFENCYTTVTGGSTDGKVYSLYSVFKNISGIVIPCENKHNKGTNEFVCESAKIQDIKTCLNLLTAYIEDNNSYIDQDLIDLEGIKKDLSITKKSEDISKKNLYRVYIRNKWKLKHNTGTALNLYHRILNILGIIVSRLYF